MASRPSQYPRPHIGGSRSGGPRVRRACLCARSPSRGSGPIHFRTVGGSPRLRQRPRRGNRRAQSNGQDSAGLPRIRQGHPRPTAFSTRLRRTPARAPKSWTPTRADQINGQAERVPRLRGIGQGQAGALQGRVDRFHAICQNLQGGERRTGDRGVPLSDVIEG